MNGYKNKTHIYAVCKRPTPDLEAQVDWKWGDVKRYSMQRRNLKKKKKYLLNISIQVEMFISDKTDFKMKTVTGDKDTTQWSRDQSKKPKLTIYISTIGVPLYREQRLITINGEIYNNTINSWGFNIPLTPTDRSSRQKINKETQALKDRLCQIGLIDIYRTFHPKVAE